MASAADLDAEREVDLRSYLSALATRWWLLAAGLVGGIIIGLLISLGGRQVWTANTTVYLGQPLSPTGSVQIQSDSTNPSVVGTIIHSRSEEHTSELQSRFELVCRLLLEKKKL